jgi:hypothetical protein
MNPLALAALILALHLSSFYGDGTIPVEADTFYRINPKKEARAYYLRIKVELRPTLGGDEREQLSEADVYAADKKIVLQRIRFGPAASTDPEMGMGESVLAEAVDQADFNFDGYLVLKDCFGKRAARAVVLLCTSCLIQKRIVMCQVPSSMSCGIPASMIKRKSYARIIGEGACTRMRERIVGQAASSYWLARSSAAVTKRDIIPNTVTFLSRDSQKFNVVT